MRRILKYKLNIDEKTTALFPPYTKILHVSCQYVDDSTHLVLWVLMDDEAEPTCKRTFLVYATGEAIPEDKDLIYIGTAEQKVGGYYVWHVFEKV